MTVISFPSSPTVGEIFLAANGVYYTWDGTKWVGTGIGGVGPTGATGATGPAATSFVTGMIMLWSGSIASIPSGWALCDGTNGTPNLRDRFIVGAGSSYAVGATGGTADAVVVSHTHAGSNTDAAGAASGTLVTGVGDFGDFQNASGVFALSDAKPSRSQGAAGVGSFTTATMSIPNHTHSITIGATGVSGTNANLPPYYALAYIMKL